MADDDVTESDEEIALSRTTTVPQPLTKGERLIMEERLGLFEQAIRNELRDFRVRLDEHVASRNVAATEFYQTRMMPLERTVAWLGRLVWFTLGVSITTLVVVLWLHRH